MNTPAKTRSGKMFHNLMGGRKGSGERSNNRLSGSSQHVTADRIRHPQHVYAQDGSGSPSYESSPHGNSSYMSRQDSAGPRRVRAGTVPAAVSSHDHQLSFRKRCVLGRSNGRSSGSANAASDKPAILRFRRHLHLQPRPFPPASLRTRLQSTRPAIWSHLSHDCLSLQRCCSKR